MLKVPVIVGSELTKPEMLTDWVVAGLDTKVTVPEGVPVASDFNRI
jgi:hypothetical protein